MHDFINGTLATGLLSQHYRDCCLPHPSKSMHAPHQSCKQKCQLAASHAGLLIATHLYAFMLVPATMYVFYGKLAGLQKAGARSPFAALTGLGYVMVGGHTCGCSG